MKKLKKESGMAVIEATIVFPVMFLVIFFMTFVGNAYVQKCRVDNIVTKCAIAGAAYCADPMLDEIESGNIPTSEDGVDVEPYRYIFGGMTSVVEELQSDVEKEIEEMGAGLFSGMEPTSPEVVVEFNNGFVYSTFTVSVTYTIEAPVAMLDEERLELEYSSYVEMPVSDTSEFIRNVDMVEDYMERTGAAETITDAIDSVKELISFE